MKPFLKHINHGFTLPELVVVIGIVTTLFAIGAINLLGAERKVSLTAAVDSLITDLRQQQLKAMVGDTEGRPIPDSYGIHFESQSYTLFHGASYSPGAEGNFVISLEPTLNFPSVTFPDSIVIFTRASGDIAGSPPGSGPVGSITIQNTTDSQTQTIYLNRYGVITAVQ
jgi:prepilin-type N-terminal cleavage/methylation domain-containing protein